MSQSDDAVAVELIVTCAAAVPGLRVTCCKSAKDRTGMGVTLEQARILSEDFDLAAAEFDRALDCMRRWAALFARSSAQEFLSHF